MVAFIIAASYTERCTSYDLNVRRTSRP